MNQTEQSILRGLTPAGWRYVHHDYAGRKVSRYGDHPERVNGHDPIETHALYTADQLLAAVREAVAGERAAVAAWLNGPRLNPNGSRCTTPRAIRLAIQRGAYLPTTPPSADKEMGK